MLGYEREPTHSLSDYLEDHAEELLACMPAFLLRVTGFVHDRSTDVALYNRTNGDTLLANLSDVNMRNMGIDHPHLGTMYAIGVYRTAEGLSLGLMPFNEE